MDRATCNLPSKNLDETSAFYAALGFAAGFKDEGWMILHRGTIQLEFFPQDDVDPLTTSAGACVRVDDLDALYADFRRAVLPDDCWATPRLTPPTFKHGLRMFALVDPDGNLIRCIDNKSTQDSWPDQG